HDERPVGAGTRVVDGARHQLLAGAGLALDQHGRVEGGYARDQLVELHHLGGLADQVLEPIGRAKRLPVVAVLTGQASRLERATDDHDDLLHPERLGQVVIRAGAHRLDRGLDAGERREDHDRQLRLDGAQALEDREPIEVGHAEVDERQVEGLALRQAHARFAAGGQADAVALPPEHLGQQLAGYPVVVGDEQRLGRAHAPSSAGGSDTRKVVPRPSALSTSMCPPCSRTTSAVIQSPRPTPLPDAFVEKNGSKIRPRASSAMPEPVSATEICTPAPAGAARAAITIRPSEGVASIALVRRFKITCWSCSDCPRTTGSVPSTRTSSVSLARLTPGRISSTVSRISRSRSTGRGSARAGRVTSRSRVMMSVTRVTCASITASRR